MMTTVEHLLEATKDIWESYYEHPFVKGIENGTLDREKFRYYIVQDFLYLQEYAKICAMGIVKARTIDNIRLFSHYVNLLTEGEMDIHRGYFGKVNLSKEELDNTPRTLDNLSYTSYMLRVGYEGNEAEVLAAILSCAYSYECIARNMVKNNPECLNHEFYGDWIKEYISPEYCGGNILLIDAMNELTKDYTEEQLKHLTDIFVACSRYEYLFWEFSWNMGK